MLLAATPVGQEVFLTTLTGTLLAVVDTTDVAQRKVLGMLSHDVSHRIQALITSGRGIRVWFLGITEETPQSADPVMIILSVWCSSRTEVGMPTPDLDEMLDRSRIAAKLPPAPYRFQPEYTVKVAPKPTPRAHPLGAYKAAATAEVPTINVSDRQRELIQQAVRRKLAKET